MPQFIIKADDFRLDQDAERFLRLAELCRQMQVPCMIGVVGSRLRDGRFADRQRLAELVTAGAVELWNHSYSHQDLTSLEPAAVARELAQTTSACRAAFGVDPCGFGAPFNRGNAQVFQAALELKLGFCYEQLAPARARITPEHNVPLDGQPSLAQFQQQVASRAGAPLLIVQLHPSRWHAASFAVFAACLAWLLDSGYTPLTGSQAASLAGALPAAPVGAHTLVTGRLSAFWRANAQRYDRTLANFSSYFLGRFDSNAAGIRALLATLALDGNCHAMADVGCGLVQWGLPLVEHQPDCAIHAFDTNPTIAAALTEAGADGLLPAGFTVHSEDFTTTTAIPAGQLDLITCANALNYIPAAPFAATARRLTRRTGRVVLVNQTAAFNQAGFTAARAAGNVAMATERALGELRQHLVRQGFAGFAPPRTTLTAAELSAIFYLHGFVLHEQFVPEWEASHAGQPTFQGLVFARAHCLAPEQLRPAERRSLRATLYQAGQHELDAAAFAAYPTDLDQEPLALLQLRCGAATAPGADLDGRLGALASSQQWAALTTLVAGSATAEPAHLLAGCVAGLLAANPAGSSHCLARLQLLPPAPATELAAALYLLLYPDPTP